jgi:transcriptional regulator with XRE-family HTH domain
VPVSVNSSRLIPFLEVPVSVNSDESGDTQPSLDVLRKIAIALNISADMLLFDEGERDLPNNLQLKFEVVSQMSEEDQKTIQSLIDGMILKHTASQLGAR